jgi:hypothetical protein
MARPRVDWEQVEADYVTGSESLLQIAQRIGLSARSVEKRAAAGKWAAKREAYQSEQPRTLTVIRRDGIPEVVPKEVFVSDMQGRLERYRGTLERYLPVVPCRSLEGLISALLRLAELEREWFPESDDRYLQRVAEELVKRGIHPRDLITRLRQVVDAAS